MNWRVRYLINIVGTVAVIAGGLLTARSLMEEPVRADAVEREDTGALVRVLEAEGATEIRTVRAAGTVMPASTLVVSPEVQGRIIERHPSLEEGGLIRAGDTLLRIDPRDYRIAVADARNALESARTQVLLEQGRAGVARDEWERFGEEEPSPLALREPQQRQAELQVEAARQALQRAELQLERTRIVAPVDAIVQQADADVGQLVGSQSRVAVLVPVDRFHVRASVPVADLDGLAVPGVSVAEDVEVPVRVLVGTDVRSGRLLRLLGDVDPAGRMARVLVAIDDPLHLSRPPGERRPVLQGAWVEVELGAAAPQSVVWLPREAMRDGQRAYIANADGRLEIRSLELAWREADRVAVREGIRPGEAVIVSRLPAPVDGMRVRQEGAVADGPGNPAGAVEGGAREAAASTDEDASGERGVEVGDD